NPGTFASRRDASLAPPVLSSAPVSERTTGGRPRTVACTTVASPLKAVLLAEALCAGQDSRPKRRLTVRTHEPFPFIHALALIEEPSFVVCFREKDPASPALTRKAHLRRPRARAGATHMPGAGEGSMRCKVASTCDASRKRERAFSGKCRTIAAPLWGQCV